MNIGLRRICEFESVRPTVSIIWRPGRARLPGWIRAGLGIGVIGVQMATDYPAGLGRPWGVSHDRAIRREFRQPPDRTRRGGVIDSALDPHPASDSSAGLSMMVSPFRC